MTVATPPMTLDEKVADFLAQRHIAVVGVSVERALPGCAIYRKLKGAGYRVTPVHPTVETFDGDRCYPDLASIPGRVDGVVLATRPALTTELVRQAVAAHIPRVWMHESLMHGATSVSAEAIALCEEHGVTVIAGACPMMYCAPVDVAHRCMCWLMRVTGKLPE